MDKREIKMCLYQAHMDLVILFSSKVPKSQENNESVNGFVTCTVFFTSHKISFNLELKNKK